MEQVQPTKTQPFIKFFQSKQAATVFQLLLIIDLLYIGFHLLLKLTPILENDAFDLSKDLSYSELFQYVKYLWIIVLLFGISRSKNQYGYLSWAFLFCYILLDDALMFHEQIGKYVAYRFELPEILGIRALDIGELSVFIAAGLLLFPWILYSYFIGTFTFRIHSLNFFTFFAVFAFFGLFIDFFHEAVDIKYVYGMISIVEDGGEMIIISLFTSYLFWLSHKTGKDSMLFVPLNYVNRILNFRISKTVTK